MTDTLGIPLGLVLSRLLGLCLLEPPDRLLGSDREVVSLLDLFRLWVDSGGSFNEEISPMNIFGHA